MTAFTNQRSGIVKLIMISVVLLTSCGCKAQNKANADSLTAKITTWVHTYYKQPKPDSLYYIYNKLLTTQLRMNQRPGLALLAFMGSAMKDNDALITQFYDSTKNSRSDDAVQSLGWMLWYIHSEHSLQVLVNLADHVKKKELRGFLVDMRNKPQLNVNELILHHDMLLLYDFFATGNQQTFNAFLSKVDFYESTKWVEKQAAQNVIYTLRHHCKQDKALLAYIRNYLATTTKEPTTKILNDLVAEIELKK